MAPREEDKASLPATQAPRPPRQESKWRILGLATLFAGVLTVVLRHHVNLPSGSLSSQRPLYRRQDAKICPQSDTLYPKQHAELWESLKRDFDDKAFTTRAVALLGGAVRIPTESYDSEDMGAIGVDKRWEVFGPFQDYLVRSFPLTHVALTLTKVNTYGLLYEWKGSDVSLKPLLFTAHQDVVPVDAETVGQWTHPPYSGYYGGESIWGRGSSDDKSGLIGVLASIESLLEKGFKPARTIVLASGFDEEAGGKQGAQHLSAEMLKIYGEDGFALLVDEGGAYGEIEGSVFAVPAIAEKGRMNTMVMVSTPGGHSSIPPPHTSIGILARFLVEFEANPIEPHLERGTPVYTTVQCVAEHAKDFPADLRALVETSIHSDSALRKLEATVVNDPFYKPLIGTTQAIDLIRGGVKTNALPEEAWAVVNHLIATQSSIAAVQERDTNLLKNLAKEFNLTYTAFGSAISIGDASAGALNLTTRGTPLEPSPTAPTGEDSAPWRLLSGTIKATYNAHRGLDGEDTIFVSPGTMTGNTDTRHYWKLTRHIVRYNHHYAGANLASRNNVHTVNEHLNVDNFVETIRFFSTLILNADESGTM